MQTLEPLVLEINEQVKRQYEVYPYPDYSLFVPLRTQEAFASHSLFSGQLLKEQGIIPAVRGDRNSSILIAGSGDILPFVLSFWEPESSTIHALDLSERSIQRARLRSSFRPHHFRWQVGNLEDQSFALPTSLAHIDSYGVLHHLAKPADAIQRLSQTLEKNGTCRIMVYNSATRHWIHQLQASFHLLGLSAFDRKDLDRALAILKELMRVSPRYAERLAPMKAGIFHHSARFVDTFFHAHEGRLEIEDWLKAFSEAGLEPMGLYDRYAELDDLENPLLKFPDLTALKDRVADRRFENNFEIFLAKKSVDVQHQDRPLKQPTRWFFKMPPKAWFSYTETNSLPLATQFKLWHAFVKTMNCVKAPVLDQTLKTLKPEAIQRLARLGAIFPSNVQSPELKTLLLKPIHEKMDPPTFANEATLQSDSQLRKTLEAIAREKSKAVSAVDLVMKRLEAGQKI
ncbi:MAG: methyltransferase domain-containing protein [Proteobacteria bacterium]|nr:MAG: methyltransferase domain-containing protein [Pseudomonadota bacterium]